MTATIVETSTHTEWGVRRVWPDGHTEVERVDSRHSAEVRARHNAARRSDGDGTEIAEVVARTITVTDWQVAS